MEGSLRTMRRQDIFIVLALWETGLPAPWTNTPFTHWANQPLSYPVNAEHQTRYQHVTHWVAAIKAFVLLHEKLVITLTDSAYTCIQQVD